MEVTTKDTSFEQGHVKGACVLPQGAKKSILFLVGMTAQMKVQVKL